MKARVALMLAIAAISIEAVPASAVGTCDVRSGPKTAALVELYTSEGCSSCPPADKRLAQLRQDLGPAAEAVPLALHVDYWDYMGWHDPYAKDAFKQRQDRLVQLNHHSTVYTPHFFVAGTELGLSPQALADKVRRVNAAMAQADIRLQSTVAGGDVLKVSADATAQPGHPASALYVAVTESGLTSKVTRGENGGVTLLHDHVVRAWIGPIALRDNTVHVQRDIPLPAAWNKGQLELVAFVADEASGNVLQAVNAGKCAGS